MNWFTWLLIALVAFYFWLFPMSENHARFTVICMAFGYLISWTCRVNKDLTELKSMIKREKDL